MPIRVKWYELGWWHEQRFPTQDDAEVFALIKSLEKRTEARLFVSGQWVGTWKLGEPVL